MSADLWKTAIHTVSPCCRLSTAILLQDRQLLHFPELQWFYDLNWPFMVSAVKADNPSHARIVQSKT